MIAPRLLTPAQARRYLGNLEPADLARPTSVRGELRYDRAVLDRKLDELSGLTRSSSPDDAEDALQSWISGNGAA